MQVSLRRASVHRVIAEWVCGCGARLRPIATIAFPAAIGLAVRGDRPGDRQSSPPQAPPGPPTLLTALAASTQVTLSFNAVAGAATILWRASSTGIAVRTGRQGVVGQLDYDHSETKNCPYRYGRSAQAPPNHRTRTPPVVPALSPARASHQGSWSATIRRTARQLGAVRLRAL